jgi:hypothetical protein
MDTPGLKSLLEIMNICILAENCQHSILSAIGGRRVRGVKGERRELVGGECRERGRGWSSNPKSLSYRRCPQFGLLEVNVVAAMGDDFESGVG